MQGAWIEIRDAVCVQRLLRPSLPVQGAWIEIVISATCALLALRSLPVQGAWIEIAIFLIAKLFYFVAPRAGSVD